MLNTATKKAREIWEAKRVINHNDWYDGCELVHERRTIQASALMMETANSSETSENFYQDYKA
jgi:hypothetical protein